CRPGPGRVPMPTPSWGDFGSGKGRRTDRGRPPQGRTGPYGPRLLPRRQSAPVDTDHGPVAETTMNLIRVASTWEGIRAAGQGVRQGIQQATRNAPTLAQR